MNRCGACGQDTLGRNWTFENRPGEVFCDSCANGPRCYDCGGPSGRAWVFDDGRKQCDRCRSSSVLDKSSVLALANVILDFMHSSLRMSLSPLPEIHLASLDQIRAAFETPRPDAAGICIIKSGSHPTILVPYGMARLPLATLLTHELAHVWVFQNARTKLAISSIAHEGFCEWVAWQTAIGCFRSQTEANKIAKKDGRYGTWFRAMASLHTSIPAIDIPILVSHEDSRIPRAVLKDSGKVTSVHGLGVGIFKIGRDKGCCNILIENPYASRTHSSVQVEARGTAYLRDLGSRNGTKVNGRDARSSALRPGDTIQLGSTSLIFDSVARPV